MKKMFVLAALLSGLLPGGFATSGPVPSEIRRADANLIPYVEETSTGIVEDFESGTLSDQWTLDSDFGFNREAAVSDRSTIGWVEKLPFNKDGDYFFNGWSDQGGAAAEAATWRLLSQPFTLTGNGLITAKMGGNSCRLSLYSASEEPLADSAQALVSVDTTPWWTDNMDMTRGGNNVTMRRVYMDASAFVGQKVILALEDYRTGVLWAHAFFDSINTNVDLSEFKFKVDVVEQKADGWEQSKKFAFTDYYQAGESEGDLTYVKEAYEFLADYYASARSQEDIYTYCELPGDKLSAIVDQYDKLSPEAKAIVDRSDDFSYSGYLNHKDEVVYEEDIVINTVGKSMINLRALAPGKTSVSGALVVNGGSDSSLLAMVCGLALLLIGGAFGCVYLHLRKKKENK